MITGLVLAVLVAFSAATQLGVTGVSGDAAKLPPAPLNFQREVAFPGDNAYLITSGSAAGTFITGAVAEVQHVRVHVPEEFAGGVVHLRGFGAGVDTDTLFVPAGGAAQMLTFELGREYAEGLVVVADSGLSGKVEFLEHPRTTPLLAPTELTLNRVREILGKSTPHPFHGQKKWGLQPAQTATDATWDGDIDGEVFYVQFPIGYTTQGAGFIRLVLAHHPLKLDASTGATETRLDEECAQRGYLFVSPTSMLSDTWPNDTSVDNLEAVLWWMIRMAGANPDDLNLTGFSLGGQQVSRFACTHRDPDGLMARTICPVAADWEQLVWQRKQHRNTNLGNSIPLHPGDPPNLLCDPDPGLPTSSLWRAQQQRLDQMGGPWPGGDNLSAVGLQWRASAILALDPATYAETGPMTSASPIVPLPSADDIPGASIDQTRSLAASGLWTPTLITWGDDDALTIIPPLTDKLIELYGAVNPDGSIGFQPVLVNVGTWGGEGAHTWDILDTQQYFAFLDAAPPIIRLPTSFEYVTHRHGTSSYCTITKSAAFDLSRFRCTLVMTPGAEGWRFSREVRVARIAIDASRTPLGQFDFGAAHPLHVTTSSAWDIVVKNLPHVPAGASGTNVGTVSIGFDGANSIRIQPAGPGPVVAVIT